MRLRRELRYREDRKQKGGEEKEKMEEEGKGKEEGKDHHNHHAEEEGSEHECKWTAMMGAYKRRGGGGVDLRTDALYRGGWELLFPHRERQN